MILKTDCRHFPGDRPCVPNKLEGKLCPDCEYYSPVNFKILIIKLDAIGDVLRTTSILHALKEKYPDSHITWITKNAAKDIFKNNHLVDDVRIFESSELQARLQTEMFDLLIHPDASPARAQPRTGRAARAGPGGLTDPILSNRDQANPRRADLDPHVTDSRAPLGPLEITGQMNHGALHPIVADQDIAAVAEQAERHGPAVQNRQQA